LLFPNTIESPNFIERTRNELLTTIPRIDAHHQNIIDDVEHIFEQSHRCSGINDHARLSPVILNHVQSPIEIPADFVMYADTIRPGFDEDRCVGVRILNHEVVVEFERGELTQGFRDGCSHGEVGNKMTVHDVDVNHADAGLLNSAHFLTQTCEVGSEDGWNNLEHEISLPVLRESSGRKTGEGARSRNSAFVFRALGVI